MAPNGLPRGEIDARLLPQPVQTGGNQLDEIWDRSWRLHQRMMLTLVQSGAGVTTAPGPFVGTEIDGMCFHTLRPAELGLCVAVAVWEGDLPGVVVQFLRAVCAVVSQYRRELAARTTRKIIV